MASNSNTPSILGHGLKIRGQMFSDDDIQIDGEIYGNIVSSTIVIGTDGIVKGTIAAKSITVHGKVEGSVYGEQVHLCASAKIEGNIYHTLLAIEKGAHFSGNAHCVDTPLSEDSLPKFEPPDLSATNDKFSGEIPVAPTHEEAAQLKSV